MITHDDDHKTVTARAMSKARLCSWRFGTGEAR
jgi:hypothetical protein